MGRYALKTASLLFFLPAMLFAFGCSRNGGTSSDQQPPAQTAAVEKAAPAPEGSENAADGAIATKGGPQIVTALFKPQLPRQGDQIDLTVRTRDADQSSVTFRYQWSLNKVQLADISGPSLKAPLKKGDVVSVVITPFKGDLEGESVTRFTSVGNSPPTVRSSLANPVATARRYTAKVIASDPDEGDTLSYSLLQGPAGMSINAETGEITWDFPDTITSGTYSLSVSVKDADGSETVLNVPISVTAPNRAAAPK